MNNIYLYLPKISLISLIAEASLMNDAKIMSTPCSTPNFKSLLSFSDTAGRSTGTPGKLTPLRLPNEPPFSIVHTI